MRILTGIQPSGTPHIGNYFGAMRQIINIQEKGETFVFLADYHSLTTSPEPEQLRKNVFELALNFLSCGVNTEKNTVLFRQSDVPEVCELTWILNNVTPVGLLERAHSYKDKIAKGFAPNNGLFSYPVLMASDILLYQSNLVPVGKDQKQHLEITRDIAIKFNNQYGDFSAPHYNTNKDVVDNNDADFYFARGAYDFDFAKLGVDYISYQDKHGATYIGSDGATATNKVDFKGTKPELFGVNLNIPVQQFNVFGEYWKNTTAPDALKDTAWNAGLSYGAANWKKPGTWDLSVAYNSVGNAVYFGDTGWQTNILDAVYKADRLKFWNAMGDVTLTKNVQLHAEYAFAADADKGADPDDAWTVSLNYKF